MKNKITLLSVLAVLCPFGSKEQRARNKEQRATIKDQRPKLKAYLQVALLLCLFSGPLMAQVELLPLSRDLYRADLKE